jgi:hypothetical protein
VIGRSILLNTRSYQIVGVSERGFSGSDLQRPADLEIPATRLIDYMPAFVGIPDYDWKTRLFLFSAIARLKPETTSAGAAAQLTRLNRAYLNSTKLDSRTAEIQLADGSAGLQSSSKLANPAINFAGCIASRPAHRMCEPRNPPTLAYVGTVS